MASAWYNQPEARSLLAGLTHQDLRIVQIGNHFEWELPEHVDRRLEFWLERTVDNQLGYTLSDIRGDEVKEDRWFSLYEEQASVNDIVCRRFGNPSTLMKWGLIRANSLFQKDPLCLLRKVK